MRDCASKCCSSKVVDMLWLSRLWTGVSLISIVPIFSSRPPPVFFGSCLRWQCFNGSSLFGLVSSGTPGEKARKQSQHRGRFPKASKDQLL